MAERLSGGGSVDLRPSSTRFRTRGSGRDTRHSFSFGDHYDPDDIGFGLLLASNEDVLQPGAGYDPHRHQDTEIVTWVLEGALAHVDSTGAARVVRSGTVQVLSSGSGVVHAERNAAEDDGTGGPVHLFQMWVLPDRTGDAPEYATAKVHLHDDELVPVASGDPSADAAARIRQRGATLHAARLTAGGSVLLPAAPYLHVQVARGLVELDGAGVLAGGDVARLRSGGPRRLAALEPAEVLAWEMQTPGRLPSGA